MGTNPVVGFCEWRHFSVKNFSRLATAFDRYAMTREINDGLLAPRFAPGQRGYVQAGLRVSVTPAVPASAGQDSDNR